MSKVIVHDRWWPDRIGTIVKRGKSSCWVKWSDGELWRYDRDHMQFLERLGGGAP